MPRALVLLTALAGLHLAGACAPPIAPPNVLLVSIDTLRADRLSCAGYPRPTTPHLDALAARGVRFTHAQSPRAKTTPAMASVLTGLYPHDHGVRDLTTPLDTRPRTLAEAFGATGYRTGAVVGNFVLQRELAGLDRGFDVWVEDLPDLVGVPPDDVPQRRATSLTDEALGLLGLEPGDRTARLTGDAPWFLWLHYMDPHGLYDAPAEYAFPPAPPAPIDLSPARSGEHEPFLAAYNVVASDWSAGRVDASRVIARYDTEVRYVDAALGRLVAALEAAGLADSTWIVVLGDHGESLGEHRYWFEHGRYAYEATCRVPLLVVPPPDAEVAAAVRGEDISLADVFPTLVDALRLARGPSPGTRPVGRSRAALLDGPSDAPHPVFCEKVERADLAGAVQTKAVRIGDWKLLRRYASTGDSLTLVDEELFDLVDDPSEARDLAGDPPADAPLATLRAALLTACAADVDLAGLALELQRERDQLARDRPEVLRSLEALGY